jgi:predicted secreted protein
MSHHPWSRLVPIILAVSLIALAAPGAAAHGRAVAAQASTAVTTTITAHATVGQEVLVAVKTNPSTGYHWTVQQVSGLTMTTYEVPTRKVDPKHPLVGVPIIRVYQITVVTARSTPYTVLFVELTPAGTPSGAFVLVTINTQP